MPGHPRAERGHRLSEPEELEAATIIRNANPRRTKMLLQALVERIDVESRANIQPVFFVPAVRPPDGSVPPARIELAHAV
jgi:hypothetical protein